MVDSLVATDSKAAAPQTSSSRRWIWVAVIAVLLVAAFVWSRGQHKNRAAAAAASSASAESRPVSVQTVTVQRADIPVVLEGLGSVTPIATVLVKTQVDGRLENVYFKEGQTVKKGQLLAQIDPRPYQIQLQQGQAALTRDNAQIQNARLNLSRYETLRTQNLVAQQQIDDQRTLVAQTEAAIQSDRAQISSAQLMLNYSHITSPIAGVTGVRLVDPGNIIRAADANGIVVVTQLDPIAVMFTLPEDDLQRVSQAMAKGPLQVRAFSRDGTKSLAVGQVLMIDNQINTATATIRLKATFDNTDHALWPNAFVKARLTLETQKNAITLPNAAIQRGPQGTFVYLVKNGQAQVKPIEVASIQGDLSIIRSGIDESDVVVTEGQNQLRPGAKVAVRPSGAPTSSQPGKPR